MRLSCLTSFCVVLLLLGCTEQKKSKLPILGHHKLLEGVLSEKSYDTIHHSIRDFRFLNQDSNWVTEETFSDKVYVADFFFTSCPTICPIMAKNMLVVYESYKDNPEVGIISHSIDPEYDTVEILRKYANGLQVDSKTWHFVTGKKEDIYDLAIKSYLSVAVEDSTEPGGFLHSGYFLLVDKKRRVRGVYDGTSTTAMDTLVQDIGILLDEYK